jgi:hypothetical protein
MSWSDNEEWLLIQAHKRTGKSAEELVALLNGYREQQKYPFDLFGSTLPAGDDVVLNETEMEICKLIGPKRTAAARAAGRVNMRKADPEKEKFIEINGLCGELTYAKRHNLYPFGQFEVKARSVRDDDGDHKHNGYVVDVKITEYQTGALSYADWKKKDTAHFLCLVTGDYRIGSRFVIRGYMLSRELLAEDRLGAVARLPNQYGAEQRELYDLATVFKKLKEQP